MNFNFNFSGLILLIAALVVFILVPCVSAEGLEEIGRLTNGPSYDLVESNGYLYVGQGSEVRTYDISTDEKKSALTWKDSVSSLSVGNSVGALYTEPGYLYIATPTRFIIADISLPKIPVIIASLDNPYPSGSLIKDVIVKGNFAYLAIYSGGIQVVDITDRANPRFVQSVKLSGYNRPTQVTIDGNYLYVGTETDNRLDIVDLSNPLLPQVVGSYKPATGGFNSTSGVAIKDGYAYIAEYHNGVRVINVKNPAAPVEVTNLMGIDANDIKILGSYAYVSVRYQGFSVIDISNPQNIRIIGKATNAPYYNEGIFPIQNYTFISLESMGFGIYGTSNVTAPKTMTRVNVIGGADSVEVRGNYLYIGGHNDGIWIVDISNRSQPKELSFLSNNNGRNAEVRLQGNNLYIAGAWAGLCIADISNPADPRLVLYDFGDSIGRILPDGNYVYTSAGIVDLTNMGNPVYASKSPNFEGTFAKFNDRYLLVASNLGVKILDVSDKKNPTLVATFDKDTAFYDVKVYGNTAIALSVNKVTTIDLSTITSPVKLDELNYSGTWSGYVLSIDGSIAYAGGTGIGPVRSFDISDPKNIKLIDSIDISGVISSITNVNGYVFAGQKMGVYIFSSQTVTTPTPVTPSLTPTPVIPSPTVTPVIPTINDNIGVFRPSTHTNYQDYNGNGVWNGAVIDRAYNFGIAGDIPVSGDWNNNGIADIGVFRPSTHSFYLDYNGNGIWNGAVTDRAYNFGLTGDIPISGDWNNNGIADIGVFRPSTHSFYLDYNGNGVWNGAVIDRAYNFGIKGDSPVSGKWR
jgi:hypothetical protein